MSLISQLQNFIPNPYSKKESLSGVFQKISLISSGLSITTSVKEVLVLFIVVFVVLGALKVPNTFLIFIFLIELFIILVNLGFSFLKIKSIHKINSQEDSLGSWKILLINANYDTLAKGSSLISNILGVFVFVFLLDNKLIDINIASDIASYFKYFLFIITVFRLGGFIISVLEYNNIKKIPESSDVAELDKNYSLIVLKFNIIRTVLALGIIAVVVLLLLFSGIIPREYINAFQPYLLFTIPFLIFILLLIVYNIFSYKKFKTLNLNNQETTSTNSQTYDVNAVKISGYQDEVILGSVFGIEKSIASFKDIFSRKMGSYEFLGVGRNFAPENTLLITNYRLLFIQIPLAGGDKVISGTDFVSANMMFNRSEIVQKGEEILKTNSIVQLSPLVRNEVLYQDIARLIFNKFIINIQKTNGEKLRYGFMDKEYTELINKILPEYLGNKFVSK